MDTVGIFVMHVWPICSCHRRKNFRWICNKVCFTNVAFGMERAWHIPTTTT
jgi:hypothetical protein